MKEDLKNSWLKNNIIAINVVTILLYSIGFWLFQKFDFSLLINIVGSIYLLIITPINILLLFRVSLEHYAEWLLASISLFFTILVPLYFVANYLLQTPFSFKIILTFNLILSFFIFLLFHRQFNYILENIHWSINFEQFLSFIKKRWPLLAVLFLFILLHIIDYHFYIFMPEWDGYSKLSEINNSLETNNLKTNYRGFFTVSIIIITKFTKLSPYDIFTTLLIVLQAAIIPVIFLFLKFYKLKKKFYQFIVLSATLTIPMLNLEVDVVRPQSVFIILLPIYIYFLFKAVIFNKPIYWTLATLIIIAGLNYHEFFVFTFLLHITTTLVLAFKKYYLRSQDKKDRLIFKLLFIIIILLGIISLNYFSFLDYFILVFTNIFHKIIQIENWRLWFLNDYTSDQSEQQLGWPGIFGAVQYYAYYASPLVLFTMLTIVYLKIKNNLKVSIILLYLVGPLIILLLTYSELLPRLNYTYLPERIWLVIDILLILLLPSIFTDTQKFLSRNKFTFYLYLLIIFYIIGISGTIYIAKNKKSLTSRNEYSAAQWIKQHTPNNSIVITQAANRPMTVYFAQRNFISAPTNFFSDASIKIKDSPTAQEKIDNQLSATHKFLTYHDINTISDFNQLSSKLKDTRKILLKLEKEKLSISEKNSSNETLPIYALYSMDKFKGLYAKREWWLKTNYYGAKIDNLTKKYPLVYNENDIYIWKIK